MNLPDRLREERERLGFNQTDFAAVAGATKHSQINWEKGISAPNATALSAWADAGVDVLYVITGQRSQAVAPQELLSVGDRVLLDNFHAAPPGVQAGVKTTLGAFAPGAGVAKKKAANGGR